MKWLFIIIFLIGSSFAKYYFGDLPKCNDARTLTAAKKILQSNPNLSSLEQVSMIASDDKYADPSTKRECEFSAISPYFNAMKGKATLRWTNRFERKYTLKIYNILPVNKCSDAFINSLVNKEFNMFQSSNPFSKGVKIGRLSKQAKMPPFSKLTHPQIPTAIEIKVRRSLQCPIPNALWQRLSATAKQSPKSNPVAHTPKKEKAFIMLESTGTFSPENPKHKRLMEALNVDKIIDFKSLDLCDDMRIQIERNLYSNSLKNKKRYELPDALDNIYNSSFSTETNINNFVHLFEIQYRKSHSCPEGKYSFSLRKSPYSYKPALYITTKSSCPADSYRSKIIPYYGTKLHDLSYNASNIYAKNKENTLSHQSLLYFLNADIPLSEGQKEILKVRWKEKDFRQEMSIHAQQSKWREMYGCGDILLPLKNFVKEYVD